MVFWRILLLLGCAAFCANAGVIGSIQGITVTGRLACDPDDLLNTTISDAKGFFQVYGEDKEVTAIEPYLLIKHSCDNGHINPVSIRLSFQLQVKPVFENKYLTLTFTNFKCTITDEHPIPKEYIGKTYDMHILSLNIAGKKHNKKCSSE
uniref:Transthyretin-like family protein n=1 Tax=Elaeophora elaphi TaxID=1147741 RepID=A0A0R3RKE3_9BILA